LNHAGRIECAYRKDFSPFHAKDGVTELILSL